MKRGKLYSVNKHNLPALQREENLFGFGDLMDNGNVFSGTTWNPYKNQNNLQNLGLPNYSQRFLENTKDTPGLQSANLNQKHFDWGTAAGIAGQFGAAIPSGPMQIGNNTAQNGLWDAADPTWYLANGRESAAGNFLSSTGVNLTKVGMQTGNPWLMLAGAGTKVLGSGVNAIWGTKANKKNIGLIKENTARATEAGNMFNQANDNATLLTAAGQTVGATGFGRGDLYKGGWASSSKRSARKKADNLLGRENSALAYQGHSFSEAADRISENQFRNLQGSQYALGGGLDNDNMGAIDYGFMSDYLTMKQKQAEQKSDNMANLFAGMPSTMFGEGGGIEIKIIKAPSSVYAFGGNLQSHGSDFSTELIHIDAGGSHSENPYDGVQVGTDSQGVPNLVEEGENIYEDYVFSNRIELDATAKEKFHFPRKKDITYAEAAKKLEKEISEHPNDPISREAFKLQMQQLEEQQERQKQEMEAQRAKEAFEALTPEEQTALMQRVAESQQQEQMSQQQVMQQQAMAQQMPQEGVPSPEEEAMMQQQMMQQQQPMMAMGGHRFDTGGALKWLEDNYTGNLSVGELANAMAQVAGEGEDYNAAYNAIMNGNAEMLGNLGLPQEMIDSIAASKNTSAATQTTSSTPTSTYKKTEADYILDKNLKKYAGVSSHFDIYRMLEQDPKYDDYTKKELEDEAFKIYKQTVTSSKLGKSLEWLDNNTDFTADTKQKLAKAMSESRWPTANIAFWSIVPILATSDENVEDYYKRFIDLGINKDEAFELATRGRSDSYTNDRDRRIRTKRLKERLSKTYPEKSTGVDNTTYSPNVGNAPVNRYYSADNESATARLGAASGNEGGLQYSVPANVNYATASTEPEPTSTGTTSTGNAGANTGNTGNGGSAGNTGTTGTTGTTGNRASNNTTGHNPYAYYTTNVSNYGTPTGFTVDENGNATGYTQDYKNLVNELTVNDVKKWAAANPNDPSLLSFKAQGNSLDKLTDAELRKGATDGIYGFMHRAAAQIMQDRQRAAAEAANREKQPAASVAGVQPAEPPIAANTATGVATAKTVVDATNTTGTEGGDATEVTDDGKKKVVPILRNEWPRYAGLFGPVAGLGMMAAGIGKPDYSGLNAAMAIANRPIALASYQPITGYLKYNPLDIWAQQNRMDANTAAANRAIINSSAPQGTRTAGLLASTYNGQLADGDLFQKALAYNDAQRAQAAGFNRGTNQYNSQQYGATSQYNANAINANRASRAQLAANIAQQQMAADAAWNSNLYGNTAGLFKGIGDYGRENAEWNMVSRLAADGYTNLGDSYIGKMLVEPRAKGGKIRRKKGKRGLTF